jgi:HD-GYP domain-containing protein (c-di-GMP phosphodiesterase class II)
VGSSLHLDALTHVRPYMEAWSMSDAMVGIEQERGWQFDIRIVDALVRVHCREASDAEPCALL